MHGRPADILVTGHCGAVDRKRQERIIGGPLVSPSFRRNLRNPDPEFGLFRSSLSGSVGQNDSTHGARPIGTT